MAIPGFIEIVSREYGPDEAPSATRIGSRFSFQYNPEKVDDVIKPAVTGTAIPGGSHRRLGTGASGEVTHAISLHLWQDSADEDETQRRYDWLKSLAFGSYDGNGYLIDGPPRVRLGLGPRVYTCRCTGWKGTILLFTPQLKVRHAQVDLTFEEDVDTFVDGSRLRR